MTTALDAVKAAYPSQYYGIPSTAGLSATNVVDIWNAVDYLGGAVNILSLAAASALVPFTSDEWALVKQSSATGYMTVPVSGLVLQYPGRFYCTKEAPCAVYDMWGFSTAPTEPVIGDLYPITATEYSNRQASPRQQYYDVETGALADYVAPVVVQTLAEQAATALATARSYVYNNYGILNEATPASWVTYLTALMAIANGTDTTSTALPTEPTASATSA